MVTIRFRFPGGRYHATPPGHHVNEGVVEWPPSPWRILRALLSCGYTTLGWPEPPPEARQLIETLAGCLPKYWLPPATIAHSRHYMPLDSIEKGRIKTTLVFDTWADVGEGSLTVRWDRELDPGSKQLLRLLAGNLPYLGRSESWVEAELLADDFGQPSGREAFPHVGGTVLRPGFEQVMLQAAVAPEEFLGWREQGLEGALRSLPLPDAGKRPSVKLLKSREKASRPFPDDLIDALQWDTVRWKRSQWSQAPGSRRVLYWRRADALQVCSPIRTRPRPARPVGSMLLALSTPSGRRGGLPSIARTLPQAELLHRSLLSLCGRGMPLECPELTGRDEEGRPLRKHQHAHLLPLDLNKDGALDHVLIWAPMGLSSVAQEAVRSLRRTWTKGAGELQTALAVTGDIRELLRFTEPPLDGLRSVLGAPEGACVWESATPFVPPRFVKRRGKNTIEQQVHAELASRELPSATVELVPSLEERARRLRHFVRARRGPDKAPPVDCGFAIRIAFDKPTTGPLCLGYGSHFGLGRFAAVSP